MTGSDNLINYIHETIGGTKNRNSLERSSIHPTIWDMTFGICDWTHTLRSYLVIEMARSSLTSPLPLCKWWTITLFRQECSCDLYMQTWLWQNCLRKVQQENSSLSLSPFFFQWNSSSIFYFPLISRKCLMLLV